MQSLLEFSAIKSCPELSADYILLSDSPPSRQGFTNHLQLTYPAYQRLSESEFDSSSNGAQEITITTLPDDTIEILSCHVDREDDDDDSMGGSSAVPDKLANGESPRDDPAAVHRKRVVRAVGAVTFLLLLFSLILIGISLNMSKEIDELERTSPGSVKNSQPESGFYEISIHLSA
ncbi:unnamed protein product [Candidula unifasciata]|uniref:Uncharacterized protein n=1 Tax=Candidula unifasciata TaxID=100452 RepID=A0A8S3Z3U0_9EUPU|nr:unnamed protein product [Candidula unifasciata]